MSARVRIGLVPALCLVLVTGFWLAGCGRATEHDAGAAAPHADEGAAGEASHADHDGHGDEPGHTEGRVSLAPEAVRAGEIETAVVGPREIAVTVDAPGEIRLDAERVVQVRPRYAGVVRSLSRRLGDRVAAGDLVATILSSESLAEYEVHAPLGGTVVARDVAVGQAVEPSDLLLTIADLGSVWADFALYPRVAGRVRTGQLAEVRAIADTTLRAQGRVDFVGPLLEQDTRVSHGRVVLSNRSGQWAPGLFVDVSVVVDRARVRLAVPEEAIVRMADGPAVFVAETDAFELRAVRPGRSDGRWTEIVDGISAGERVVVRNAYLLKAELTKGEASHEH